MKEYLKSANKTRSLEQTLLTLYSKQSEIQKEESMAQLHHIQSITCELEEIKSLHAKMIAENMKLKQSFFENEDKSKEITNLKKLNDKFIKEINKQTNEMKKFKIQFEDSENENKKLKDEIKNLIKEADFCKKEFEILKKENEILKTHNLSTKKAVTNKKNKKQQPSEAELELKEEVKELARINSDFINEINSLKEKIEKLKQEKKKQPTGKKKKPSFAYEVLTQETSFSENKNKITSENTEDYLKNNDFLEEKPTKNKLTKTKPIKNKNVKFNKVNLAKPQPVKPIKKTKNKIKVEKDLLQNEKLSSDKNSLSSLEKLANKSQINYGFNTTLNKVTSSPPKENNFNKKTNFFDNATFSYNSPFKK